MFKTLNLINFHVDCFPLHSFYYISLLSLEDTQQKCCFGTSICDTISERFHASYYEIQKRVVFWMKFSFSCFHGETMQWKNLQNVKKIAKIIGGMISNFHQLSVKWKIIQRKNTTEVGISLSSIRCCVCVRDENLLFLLFLLLGKISSVEQIFMSSLVFHTFPFIHFLTPLFLLPEKFSLLSGKPRRASCCLVSCILSCYVNR